MRADKLNPMVQQILIKRLEQLDMDQIRALDTIPREAAEVLLYSLVPEIDFVILDATSMQGHEYDPNRVLGGAAVADDEEPSQQQPPMPQGALGGLPR